jgi:hypothetical protein
MTVNCSFKKAGRRQMAVVDIDRKTLEESLKVLNTAYDKAEIRAVKMSQELEQARKHHYVDVNEYEFRYRTAKENADRLFISLRVVSKILS